MTQSSVMNCGPIRIRRRRSATVVHGTHSLCTMIESVTSTPRLDDIHFTSTQNVVVDRIDGHNIVLSNCPT